ncbi:hypothetical protein BJ138DRAFT_1140424 [Hygrophoropsis aurantiaca]|uniref:Uncharacterized protein n=1 Tax=Hygrophoropsis aurantiaca TaxID=72124 RepID=A0ACB8AQV9_9AGAM|nr:hypothetical protein BJ138DRAFT_1140424 [Hygrophoropsis aurantiaca]
MVALTLRSAILVTLASIISFAAAKCSDPFIVELGWFLRIYEAGQCGGSDYFTFSEETSKKWDDEGCQCLNFRPHIDPVRSIVFSPGNRGVSMRFSHNTKCEPTSGVKYYALNDGRVPKGVIAAKVCKKDHRKPQPKHSKPKHDHDEGIAGKVGDVIGKVGVATLGLLAENPELALAAV